ncbi:unnamed protein product [Rodentolepis nana]|uniref:ANK_REP_REGION domain-containing protein n=1 Tax=Rodentolepis nana TaxID=102285 RepID=A0A0R3T5Y4_RODNA|nr:unnamed protein product [Rodentolepis nana]
MNRQDPVNSDLSDIYQKWARSNLTGSLRRTGAACMSGVITTSELVEIINEIRNKPDCQDSRIDPPKQQWLEAISTSNLFEIQKILKEDPGLVNWKNPCDGTALHYAAKEGNVKCLNYLMQRGDIDVNAQCGGWTPLHVAVVYSQRLFIRTLVETYHAKNDIMDYSGKFPVDLLATEELKEELTGALFILIIEIFSI